MNYFSESYLKEFIQDIEKKDLSTPFGGSVVILSILSSIQLIKLVIRFSIKKDNEEILESYLHQLEEIKKKIIPKLDQDILILQGILNSYKSKNQKDIEYSINEAVSFCSDILEIIFPISNIIEEFLPKANTNLLSDLFIALETYDTTLKATYVHILINSKLLKRENLLTEKEELLKIKIKEFKIKKRKILDFLSQKEKIFSNFIL